MSKYSYVFTCACGCGQISDPLGKDYQRLPQGQKWYAKGCEPTENVTLVKDFKKGVVIKEDEF